nr:coniferyl aldehyde dehydrogenase [Massilia niastensis]
MTALLDIPADETMQMTLRQQRKSFLDDGPPTLGERKERLKRLRSAVLDYRLEVENAISLDFGNRSRYETGVMELMGIIQSIDYLMRHLRRFMKRERRHVGLSYRPGYAYVEYQPKGVIGIMAPWNYPFSLTMIPLATALAAGNRAMIKPSELTPRTSELIKRMLASRFLTDEVAVILGGPEVGAQFSRLAFDHLIFTGSTEVGRKVMKAASENLVPITLELGGKSPAIVAPGHCHTRTIQSLVFGKLSNAGQTCVAPDYVMVHEADIEKFVSTYKDVVAACYPEEAAGAQYTSIINERHFSRLGALLKDAQDRGASVIQASTHLESATERTLAPTVVVGVDDSMAIMQEEIFGPILPIRTYRTMAEAVDYVNARPRPLALYYFGPDNADCRTLLSRTTSGNVGINNTLMHVAQDDLPFGGIGPSGIGAYHGIEGFRSLSHGKGVYVQRRWSLPRLLHAPFGRFADLALAMHLGRVRRK